MASPFIQGNVTSTAGAATPATLAFVTQNTTAKSLLCGVVRWNSGTTITGITDNQNAGNYTVVSLGTISSVNAAFFYMLNTVGGSKPTISIAFSGTPAGVVLAIAEYPFASAATLHTSNTGTAVGTNPTSTSVSPSIGDLLIYALADQTGITITGMSAGVCGASATLHPFGNTGGTTAFAGFEDGVANSATSQTASITYATSTSYLTGLFAFSPPAAGGSGGGNGLSLAMDASLRNSGLRH